MKGFDYGGVIGTHEECNNRFGPEIYTRQALRLVEALNDEECVSFQENARDPSIRVLFINSDCLAEFTSRDLEFFKFIDVRATNTPEWSSPDFFPDKPKTNPTRDALLVALAVLTKSAAALLISRYLKVVPAHWRVLAFPYRVLDESVDFDFLFGETKPFDVGVKVWLKPFEKGRLGRHLPSANGFSIFIVCCGRRSGGMGWDARAVR